MPSPAFDQSRLEVDVDQLATELPRGSVVVLDVREPYEWQAGRIDGAVHMPLSELGARGTELDRDAAIVVACRIGGRSAVAAQALRQAGYDAWSLRGGTLAWHESGRPLAPEGGVVADH